MEPGWAAADTPSCYDCRRACVLRSWCGCWPSAVVVVIPFRVLGTGFLPPDDALRHAAKVVSGKAWAEILVLRSDVSVDPHPGWHALLGWVHRSTGADAHSLVLAAVVALFFAVHAPPLLLLRRPEAWLMAWGGFCVLDAPGLLRFMLGRPFLVSIAALVTLCLLWRRLEEPRLALGAAFTCTVAVAVAAWTHPSWYLFALFPFAVLLVGEVRAALRLAACLAGGVALAALLSGQPAAYLYESVRHPFLVLGRMDVGTLVTELRPNGTPPFVVLGLLGLLAFRALRGRWRDGVWRDPVLVLAAAGWVLGYVSLRFWSDWGLPAALVWAARELEEWLEELPPVARWQRLGAAAAVGAAVLLASSSDVLGRWSVRLDRTYAPLLEPELAEWLPASRGHPVLPGRDPLPPALLPPARRPVAVHGRLRARPDAARGSRGLSRLHEAGHGRRPRALGRPDAPPRSTRAPRPPGVPGRHRARVEAPRGVPVGRPPPPPARRRTATDPPAPRAGDPKKKPARGRPRAGSYGCAQATGERCRSREMGSAPKTGAGRLPSLVKQSTPLESPPNPRTPVWPFETGLAGRRRTRGCWWRRLWPNGGGGRAVLEAPLVTGLRDQAGHSAVEERRRVSRIGRDAAGAVDGQAGDGVVPAAVRGLVGRLARDHRADVADRGRLVRGDARPEEARDRDGRDDADDRDDDQQLDERETLLLLHLVSDLPFAIATGWRPIVQLSCHLDKAVCR